MVAPQMWCPWLKWIWITLPNRELLWLRKVLALPNASRMGLVSSTCAVCVCVCGGGGGGAKRTARAAQVTSAPVLDA